MRPTSSIRSTDRTPRAGFAAVLAAGLLTLLCTSGCGDGEPAPPLNLVLISLDTLRADRVGCLADGPSLTPAIDALCSDGLVFERTIANSPWTLPSHVSMLTGRFPRNHGVKNVGKRLASDIPVLPELLARAGYATAAVLGSPKLGRKYGLERGFQQGFEHPPAGGRAAPLQVEQSIRWMRSQQQQGKPFFLFLHNFDIHTDYDAAPEYRDVLVEPYSGDQLGSGRQLLALRNTRGTLEPDDVRFLSQMYDAGIRELDHDLTPLFEFLRSEPLASNTVVFLTSDHGEEFYEHGSVLHGVTMYRETLDVPLIVWGTRVPAGHRSPTTVQLSDLMPTMLELARVPLPDDIDGSPLDLTAQGGIPNERYAFAEADWRGDELDTFRMVQNADRKLIFNRITGKIELYDLITDPLEQTDIAASAPTRVEQLMGPLRSYLGDERIAPDRAPLSDEELETLRALGYIE